MALRTNIPQELPSICRAIGSVFQSSLKIMFTVVLNQFFMARRVTSRSDLAGRSQASLNPPSEGVSEFPVNRNHVRRMGALHT